MTHPVLINVHILLPTFLTDFVQIPAAPSLPGQYEGAKKESALILIRASFGHHEGAKKESACIVIRAVFGHQAKKEAALITIRAAFGHRSALQRAQ